MAEGRSATLLFHLQKRGFNVTGSTPDSEDDGFVTVKLRIPLPWMMAHQLRHGLRTTWFLMRHGLWPASITTLLTVMSGVTLLTVFAESDSWLRSGWLAEILWNIDSFINPFQKRLSVSFRVAYLAAFASLTGFFMIVWTERLLLRILLRLGPIVFFRARSKRINSSSSHVELLVKLWVFLIRRLTGRRNLTFSFQLSLPYLPVPSLRNTTNRFLNSVEPILPTEEFQQLQDMSLSFLQNEGPKLQRYLLGRSFLLNNYVTPWFERYVYLMARAPLAVNSNYYVMDTMKASPVKDQVFRAANLVYHLLAFHELLESEQLEPRMLAETVPLCMAQYERLFGTTRIPGREVDVLKRRRSADYILVTRRGRFYKVKVQREDGLRLTPAELAHQFRLISEHANLDAASRGPNCEEKDLMALTSLPRTAWAEIRDRHFGEGQNRKSLLTIEKAAFVLNLVSESKLSSPSSPSNTSPPRNGNGRFFGQDDVSLNKRAHFLFHGEGSDIWFDKSFNLLVFEDGQAGINAEITFGDAPVVAHMWEYALLNELIDFENCRDASALAGESLRGAPLPMPDRLEFSVSEQLSHEIKKAKKELRDLYKDIDLDILCFNSFGRDFIKTLGVSPDAFLQMALLVTTFIDGDEKNFGLAYESCHTRLFRDGRTETIRSVTAQSMAFVRAGKRLLEMMTKVPQIQPSFQELAEAKMFLKNACDVHQKGSIESLSGRGIDRHLFALNVAAKGLEIRSEFLDFANTRMKWSLSSSQQPQAQTRLRAQLPEHVANDFFCPGGGYAPISDDGYGVAYTFTATQLFFHVTCKKSSSNTNARRFTSNLNRALELMKSLLQDY